MMANLISIKRILNVLFTISIITFTIMGSATASNGGVSDQDSECTGCHGTGGNALLTITAPDAEVEAGSSGVIIFMEVNLDNTDSDDMMAGVMLLDGDGKEPSTSGWAIISDPNDNSQNYNYNEKSGISGLTTFEWTLMAPEDPGSYGFKARMMFADGGSYYLETDEITITVSDAVPDSSGTTDEVSTDDNTTTDNDLNTDNSDQPIPVNTRGLFLGVLVGLCSFMMIRILRRRYYE